MVLVVVMIAAGAGSVYGSEGRFEGEGELAISEGYVSSKISYQGFLQESGSPVTGSRDMVFSIHDAGGCAAPLEEIVRNGVQVKDGYFSVMLDVTRSNFNGSALWLGVNIGGSLIACQEILPSAYALSLAPGAEITGDVNGDVLKVENKNTIVGSTAVYAESSAASGTTYGAYMLSQSSNGVGIYGYGRGNAGGKFVSYVGDLIQGWEEITPGGDVVKRFYVDVDGDVYGKSFNLYSTSAAELLPAEQGLEAGDVLVMGSDGLLTKSTLANASNVVGVFNNQAGIVGGMPQGEAESYEERALQKENSGNEVEQVYSELGKAPLAFSGIVLVKVSAENGPILPGDMLTTASLAGHAMKAIPVQIGGVEFYLPGTILGKALDELQGGTGLMRVLISLQ
jgi:hypothetical protein